jgi:F-box-like
MQCAQILIPRLASLSSVYTSLDLQAGVCHSKPVLSMDMGCHTHWSRPDPAPNCSTMDQLPPELLAKIFLFMCHDYSRARTSIAWNAVVGVCRSWHDVALGYPALWSNIVITNSSTHRVPIMIERSAEAPLDIEFKRGWDKDHILVTNAIRSHLARVRTLKLYAVYLGIVADDMNTFIKGMTRPAPSLEILALSHSKIHTTLRPDFLAGEAPRLRSLTLIRWTLHSWNSPLLGSALTRLQLIFEDETPPAAHVLDALDRMYNLETLWLQVPLPDCHSPSSIEPRKVKLRRMRRLSLVLVSMGQAAWLLKHMLLPASVAIEFLCTTEREADSATIRSLTSALQTSWLENPFSENASSLSLKELHVSFEASRAAPLCIQGWLNCTYPPQQYPAAPQLKLRIDENEVKMALVTLLDTLPLEQLRSLRLSNDLARDYVASLASRMQALESLHCQGAPGFLEYLMNAPIELESTFPNLKHLSLGLQDFADDRLSLPCTFSVNKFIEWLVQRKEGGREVLSVKLESCYNLFKDDVRRIEAVCGGVVWDGREVVKATISEDFVCGTQSEDSDEG